MTSKPMRYVAAGVAAVALAFGAYALGSSSSNDGDGGVADASGQASSSSQSPQATRPGGGQLPQDGQARPDLGPRRRARQPGRPRPRRSPGTRARSERVMKLSNGSYEVHVITSSGEYHVALSKDFKVTGAHQGGPGAGGAAPGDDSSPGDES